MNYFDTMETYRESDQKCQNILPDLMKNPTLPMAGVNISYGRSRLSKLSRLSYNTIITADHKHIRNFPDNFHNSEQSGQGENMLGKKRNFTQQGGYKISTVSYTKP